MILSRNLGGSMNSFMGWIGGKSRLKKHIIPLIPEDCTRYIEVCGGAGWVLFGKQMKRNQLEVFNDIDGDLINLYLQIKNNCEALQKEIDWIQSRELFNSYKFELESPHNLTNLQRAARYLYLIKCSFGCNCSSFATNPKNPYYIVNRLPEIQARLKKVIIENKDFADIIKTYDREKAVFYIDPPYVGTEQYYNANYSNFNKDDHMRLNAVLKGIKGRFILSYNACDFIVDLYKEYNIQYINRKNLLKPGSNQDDFKEVIITNFTSE